jgi:hypothetical protein
MDQSYASVRLSRAPVTALVGDGRILSHVLLRGRSSRLRRVSLVNLMLASVVTFMTPTGALTHLQPRATSQPIYSVGLSRCTFVDQTRSVPSFATTPPSLLSNHRSLVTELRYPAATSGPSAATILGATPASQPGGFPLIVFAHGYNVTPSTYAPLLNAWARAGFVVAAPIFPDENSTAVALQHNANTEGDLPNEPADLAFVTRQLLSVNSNRSASCPIAFGLIDAFALALAGHSDGGVAVGMLADSTGSDPQGATFQSLRANLDFRAAIVMSGDEGGRAAYRTSATSPSLMMIQSAADQCNPAKGALRLYRDVKQNNKWFLELMAAHHMPPYNGVDVRDFNVVVGATSRFLQATLGQTSSLGDLMSFANERPAIAQIFHAGRGPLIVPLSARPLCSMN